VINGSALPPEVLSLDEVDANGNIVTAGVAQLRDDGQQADITLGDRIYTGTVNIRSDTTTEKMYRVSTPFNGSTITSIPMNFWVSGCPVTSRPSDPSKAVFDSSSNSVIFANEVMIGTAVGVAPDMNQINSFVASVGGHVVGCIPALRQYLVEITNPTADAAGVYSAINTLLSNKAISTAFPNAQSLVQPDSPISISLLCNGTVNTNCQWYLDRVRAPQAWQLAGGGDPQLGVAVIDFGVDCTLGGLPCDPALYYQDPIDHGTGVAGIIGSGSPGNATGMVGMAWNTQLYPYSFLSGSGSQYKMNELITATLSQASVRVINISAGTGADFDGQIKAAVCNAIGSGRLVVAAAGNPTGADATSCQQSNIYPARYNDLSEHCSNGADLQSGLLVVGASDINNNLASWQSGAQASCSNRLYVDLYAPGKDIVTLSTQFGYTTKSGTSYAAPLVSGAAAVLWTANPGFAPAQIHNQLINSAGVLTLNSSNTRIQTGDTRMAGKPLLDVYRAVGGQEVILAPITTPNAFVISPSTGVPLQTLVSSAPVTITGMDSPTPISISGGYYNINNGPFTSAAGSIHSGDQVQVQVRSADIEATTTSAQLNIGGVSQTYNVTTHTVQIIPNRDDFPAQHDVAPGSDILSNTRIYSGINPTPIRITGGDYSLDGGAFTHNDGLINSGQRLQLRVRSATDFATTTQASLTIGTANILFAVTTPVADTTPDAFSLTSSIALTGLTPNTVVIANPITVSGINAPAVISISGGKYSLDNGLTYTATTGVVTIGQSVIVQLTTAPQVGSTVSASLTIGDVSSLLRATTQQYLIAGTITGVSGITAAGLTLQNSSAPNVTTPIFLTPISGNEVTSLGFSLPVSDGGSYNISVATQPPGQFCTVINGTGNVSTSNISNVSVSCVKTFTVSGTVSGLTGTGLELLNNGAPIPLSNNAFAFTLVTGASYSLSVGNSPTNPMQGCVFSNGNNVGTATTDIVVPVTCTNSTLALFAGSFTGYGNADGAGAVASFVKPYGLATDSTGNVYVTDTLNHNIRKITPNGDVSTFAGASIAGSADGTGADARFYFPNSITIDKDDNIYVADTSNHTIRKITLGGAVTTFAGTAGVSGSKDDIIGLAASFSGPLGVATDIAGNVYVGDRGNYTIRKITPAGEVTTFAGTAGVIGNADNIIGEFASFSSIFGVTTDTTGNVYVADNYTIRKITSGRAVNTLAGAAGAAGSLDAPIGTDARFNYLGNMATDSADNVYVADDGNHTIRKITTAGAVSTLTGSAGVIGSADGSVIDARFNSPFGVAVDRNDNVYVADTFNHTIRKITLLGTVNTLAGTAVTSGSVDGPGATARFNYPFGITTDKLGNVYVGDSSNNVIRKITPVGEVSLHAGVVSTVGDYGDGPATTALFNFPSGLTTDSAGAVYVADSLNNAIRKIALDGTVSTVAGAKGVGSADGPIATASFNYPSGVAIDSAGNVFVADQHSHTIRKITFNGTVVSVSTFAGLAGVFGSTDGPGTTMARFNYPYGVAIDKADNIYVADDNNCTIRRITPGGDVSTLAGTAGVCGSTDGIGAAARFNWIHNLIVDDSNNVYVVDNGNSTIRKITPAGKVTTIVGVAIQAHFTPGALPAAVPYPESIAIFGTSLYIATGNGVAVVLNVP
jgi:sugar lactone lactonase YvrE